MQQIGCLKTWGDNESCEARDTVRVEAGDKIKESKKAKNMTICERKYRLGSQGIGHAMK